MQTYQGIVVDAISKKQFKGEIAVENGKIIRLEEKEHDNEQYILQGLVDAHVHIESSLTMPSIFAKMAVARGTVAVVSDPHEIVNVIGEEGIDYILEDSRKTPMKIFLEYPLVCRPHHSNRQDQYWTQ